MLIFAPAVAMGAYLIGSIPSGYLVGRIKGVDLRKVGSGNIGATNALRVLGKKWGYLVFAADIFKGWLAVGSALQQPTTFHPTMPSSRASLRLFSLWSDTFFPFGSASRAEKALPHRAES